MKQSICYKHYCKKCNKFLRLKKTKAQSRKIELLMSNTFLKELNLFHLLFHHFNLIS